MSRAEALAVLGLDEGAGRAEILAARLERVEPRRRRHYTPPLRYRILEHMKRYMLTVEETARRFLVTPQTIYNWIASGKVEYVRTAGGSVRIFVDTLWREPHAVGHGHHSWSKEASS